MRALLFSWKFQSAGPNHTPLLGLTASSPRGQTFPAGPDGCSSACTVGPCGARRPLRVPAGPDDRVASLRGKTAASPHVQSVPVGPDGRSAAGPDGGFASCTDVPCGARRRLRPGGQTVPAGPDSGSAAPLTPLVPPREHEANPENCFGLFGTRRTLELTLVLTVGGGFG